MNATSSERYLLPGHPEIFRVSNIVENGQRICGNSEFWHTDLSYVAEPSRGSLLYSIEVPTRDGGALGDTEFASTASAYDALPAEMKKRLSGLRAVHRFGDICAKVAARQGTAPQLSSAQKSKSVGCRPPGGHPPSVLRPPRLFVSEGFTMNIVGMPAAESDALLAELYAHSKRPEFVYRHRWQLCDLMMWDNWGTVHRATGGYSADERRLMHRTTLKSSMPFAALAAS